MGLSHIDVIVHQMGHVMTLMCMPIFTLKLGTVNWLPCTVCMWMQTSVSHYNYIIHTGWFPNSQNMIFTTLIAYKNSNLVGDAVTRLHTSNLCKEPICMGLSHINAIIHQMGHVMILSMHVMTLSMHVMWMHSFTLQLGSVNWLPQSACECKPVSHIIIIILYTQGESHPNSWNMIFTTLIAYKNSNTPVI